MKHRYHLGRKLAALTLVLLVFASSAQALELRVSSLDGLALSAEVFSENEAFEGVYVASGPSQLDAEVSLGARTLRAGDVLDRSMLSQLLVLPAENRDASCELVYCPIEGGEVQPSRALELSILTGKNEAPVCRDVKFETYKNIANTGVLSASDPEGDTLTYQLVKEPKRGTVDLAPDGSFTYTLAQNKVGKDVFTYTATDSAGTVSNVANVTVKIVKPTDKAMYQDLAGDTLAYTAMWLKDRGVYTGKRIAGNLCFEPEGTLTRGEFLVMAMKLLGAEPESARLTSGFADESKTPAWMRPYIVSAFKSGMVSGVTSPDGMVFRPSSNLTRAEAAVMLQNILDLPQSQEAAVFSEDCAVPVWAQASVSALESAGISIPVTTSAENLTRREAAELLYDAGRSARTAKQPPPGSRNKQKTAIRFGLQSFLRLCISIFRRRRPAAF